MVAAKDLYQQLRQHFDSGPLPFPETETGVEIRMLKDFFTEEDCRIILALGWVRVTAEKIHKRLKKARVPEGNLSLNEIKEKLDALYLDGSISMKIKKGKRKYCLDPVAVGWYEHKVDFLEPRHVEMFNEYADQAFPELWGGDGIGGGIAPQMRVIVHPTAVDAVDPGNEGTRVVEINESLSHKPAVASHDDVRRLLASQPGDSLFVLTNCICKQSQDLLDEPCKVTDDRRHCMSLGPGAQSYLDRDQGVRITKQEAIEHLEWQIEQGLVLQCGNYADELREVCACCGCCCGVLVNAKKLERPVDIFHVTYQASIDQDSCKKCGACADRCQMDAVVKVCEGKDCIYRVNLDRCIGCGVCVPGCNYNALKLLKKDVAGPPKTKDGMVFSRFKARFGTLAFMKFMLKAMLGMKV